MTSEINTKEIVKEVLAEMEREKRKRREIIKSIQQIFPDISINDNIPTQDLECFLRTIKQLKNININKNRNMKRTIIKLKVAVGLIAVNVIGIIFLAFMILKNVIP